MADITFIQRNLALKAFYQPRHRFTDLYNLVRDPLWLRAALEALSVEEGERNPGLDGPTATSLSEAEKRDLVEELAESLRQGTYIPSPGRRVYLPKTNGEMRPVGIPTTRDRVVQEVVRMILEPIYESDFLPCSHGIRPGHSPMDCIATIQNMANESIKMFWVVEGEIKGCSDRIPHRPLLEVLRGRIGDERLLDLLRQMLAAGYVEEGQVSRPNSGTFQAGTLSPLLVNLYLHQMDLHWWQKYGSLTPAQKAYRRRSGRANVTLTRYADGFVLMTNGSKAFAQELQAEFKGILADLGLELSDEKAPVTHVNDGFDFLGFRIQRLPKPGQPDHKALYVKPTLRSVERYKERVDEILDAARNRGVDFVNLIRAVNQVAQGWGTYYRHVQSSRQRKQLDNFTYRAVFQWLRHKYMHESAKSLYERFSTRDKRKGWKSLGLHGVALYRMQTIGYRPYLRPQGGYVNPYIEGGTFQVVDRKPMEEGTWAGRSSQNAYALKRLQRIAQLGNRCEQCGREYPTPQLHWHHEESPKDGDSPDQGQILCEECHRQTADFGKRQSVKTE
jgi:group II intron reverse transcriptase/maturase